MSTDFSVGIEVPKDFTGGFEVPIGFKNIASRSNGDGPKYFFNKKNTILKKHNTYNNNLQEYKE